MPQDNQEQIRANNEEFQKVESAPAGMSAKIVELEAELNRLKTASTESQLDAIRDVEALEAQAYAQEEAQFAKEHTVAPVAETTVVPVQPAPAASVAKLKLTDLKIKNPAEQSQILFSLAAEGLPQTLRAIQFAQKLKNPYVIDALHDALITHKTKNQS